jgi:hypothetical protein
MRHVPSVEWLVWKVDVDLRTRLEKILAPLSPQTLTPELQADLRQLCRALERLAEVAKHTRLNGGHADLISRLMSTLNVVVSNLRALEPSLFGRRLPFHTFERSKAEPLYGALLMTIVYVERMASRVRAIDRELDQRLLAGLVTLQNPVDDRMLTPIA